MFYGLSQFGVAVCWYTSFYLAVLGQEIMVGHNESFLRSRKNKIWRFAKCTTAYNRTS